MVGKESLADWTLFVALILDAQRHTGATVMGTCGAIRYHAHAISCAKAVRTRRPLRPIAAQPRRQLAVCPPSRSSDS